MALNVQDIPLDSIDPPKWDSRIGKTGVVAEEEREDFELLKADMADRGLRQPISVEGPNEGGRYLRVFGSRRWAAARELEWSTIPADVRPPTDDATRIADNIAENMRRRNLTSYEQARACMELRALKLKPDQIGKAMGMSPSYVTGLTYMLKELPAPILSDWQQGDPAADVGTLRRLAIKEQYPTPDDKVGAYVAHKVALQALRDEGKTKNAATRAKNKVIKEEKAKEISVSQENLRRMLQFFGGKKAPKKIGGTSAWALQLLRFVCGTVPTPPRDVLEKTAPKGGK